MTEPGQALSEVTRVLKPHGQLVIGMIDPDSFLGKIYQAKKHENKFYRGARFYPVLQVMAWLSSLDYNAISSARQFFALSRK